MLELGNSEWEGLGTKNEGRLRTDKLVCLLILFVLGVGLSRAIYRIYLALAKLILFGFSDPDNPGTGRGQQGLLERLKERR
jgi:hypothetical protein